MSRLYWLFNIFLVGLAWFATQWVGEQNPDSRWQVRAERHAARDDAPEQAAVVPVTAAAGMRPGLAPEAVDELWQRTLFRPERTEDLTRVETVGEGETPEAGPTFELMGIGIIAKEAAAIIVENRTRPPSRRVPGAARRGAPSPPAEPGKAATRHIYHVGDEVGTSGFVVKEIVLDDSTSAASRKAGKVVLDRSGEELVLRMDSGDAESVRRRETVAMAAAAKAQTAAAAKADEKPVPVARIQAGGSKTTPPPPPPVPPPVAAAAGRPGAAAIRSLSREERIKRAQEIRERLRQLRENRQ